MGYFKARAFVLKRKKLRAPILNEKHRTERVATVKRRELENISEESEQLVSTFRSSRLPVAAHLAGYSALINKYEIQIPLHHQMAATSPKNTRRTEEGWAILPSSVRPVDSDVDHLIFALKYEGVQLLALKRIFQTFRKEDLEEAAKSKPMSAYIRRLCYLYEWLLEQSLNIPASPICNYVDLIDTNQQYACRKSDVDKRFRVRDNLPGTALFCPVVFRTHKIDAYIAKDLSKKAKKIVQSAPRELIARAAAFLLLSDSKASFAIEGEKPPKDRIARWGNVISKAGQIQLNTESLEKLQRELIGDQRFVKVGLRTEGGFVGRHDAFNQPEPDHISARADNLRDLLEGLTIFDEAASNLDFHPVLSAACVSFGFVYIHPFEDGNGRIHRFLMHHVLSQRKYTPDEIVFPISSVILDDIARYKDVLESVSRPMLEHIDWKPTVRGNVDVVSETCDMYRYFDATAHCEYLFKCIARAVEKDLPEELAFLEYRDEFHRRVTHIVDMPEGKLDLLLKFLKNGHGRFSLRAKAGEYALLSQNEIDEIQSIYCELFEENLFG